VGAEFIGDLLAVSKMLNEKGDLRLSNKDKYYEDLAKEKANINNENVNPNKRDRNFRPNATAGKGLGGGTESTRKAFRPDDQSVVSYS
jgi:hypothetical protein